MSAFFVECVVVYSLLTNWLTTCNKLSFVVCCHGAIKRVRIVSDILLINAVFVFSLKSVVILVILQVLLVLFTVFVSVGGTDVQ